jgi:hypothetical protein
LIFYPESKDGVSACEQPDGGVCDNWHMTRKNSRLHPIIGLQVGSKNKANGEGCPEVKEGESSESYDATYTLSPGNLALRKQMSTTTPGFITSLVIKMATDKTP